MSNIETSSNTNIAELLDKALNAPTRNNLVLRLREGKDLGSRYDAVSEIIRLREANAKLAAALENLLNSIGICDYQKQGVHVYANAIAALANAEKE